MSHAIPLGRSVEVSVPATTANLGPGFDTLGMALTMGDRLSATVVEGTGITVEVHGVGEGEVPTDETNLIAKSLLHAFAAKGVTAQLCTLLPTTPSLTVEDWVPRVQQLLRV